MVNQNIPLEEIANSLKDYLERLKTDREKIDSEIKQVETQLAGLNGGGNFQIPTKRRRRPRGANKEAVEKTLMANPEKQFSVGDIADMVKLQTSSVRYALKKLSEQGIAKEINIGYWQAIPDFTKD